MDPPSSTLINNRALCDSAIRRMALRFSKGNVDEVCLCRHTVSF